MEGRVLLNLLEEVLLHRRVSVAMFSSPLFLLFINFLDD